jgi:glycosyltransferase involved in cell wall biosynthesis
MKQRISFIITAYNEERNIARTLDSILAQTGLQDYEVVVVDDGSADNTAGIVADYAVKNPRVKLQRFPLNRGRGAGRAAGVQAATGDFLALVDADIVLPPNWLKICLSQMDHYDAVGGTAVPDADAVFVYNLFGLEPKKTPHTVAVTGSNGLYKRKIFEVCHFDSRLADGEDSAFSQLLQKHGFRTHSIDSLFVLHKESKTFAETVRWLYHVGEGATRQLKQFKRVRLPDLAYFGFLASMLVSVGAACWLSPVCLLAPLGYVLATSLLHMYTKFVLRSARAFHFVAGLGVDWLLMCAYYAGRTTGFVTAKVPHSRRSPKQVMVCFDFEGMYGMPFKAGYDLSATTDRLLQTLETYQVKAVFFIVGKLIDEHPEIVRRIARHGHEIGLHGYVHENLGGLSRQELSAALDNMAASQKRLEKMLGKKTVAFRAPYLMAPWFYVPEVYRHLEEHGYRWVSNRELRYADELFRPDRVPLRPMWGQDNWLMRQLNMLLNWRYIRQEASLHRQPVSFWRQWLGAGAAPFRRGKLIELPIYSPLDCDLVGLPHPDEPSAQAFIDYAITCLAAGVRRQGDYYNITFHDWITGSNNRISILDGVLAILSKDPDVQFVTDAPKLTE